MRLYPRLEGRPVDNSQTFWFDGYLKVEAIWSTTRRAGEITKQEGGKFFVLEGNITTFTLLASPTYFTYNYSSILDQISTIQKEFVLEVKCLIKPISESRGDLKKLKVDFLGTPLIILEKPTVFSPST